MLKLGEKIVSDIYLGDKKIAKVFWGDKLVYQAGKPIFLDYVESTGEQYINTDYIMNSDVQEVECIFQYTDSTGTQQMFGLNVPSKDAGIFPSTSGGNIYIRGGSMSYGVHFAIDYTKKHTLYAKAELGQPFIATFDGKTTQSTNPIDVINTTHPWYLLGLNNGKNASAVYCYKGKIYLFKMYDNGLLVRDLRPCIDPKGTVCMYDMVTKKYFYNQGTGTLTAGNNINFVDYIQFDGNSWIDVEYIPSSNTRVVGKVSFTQWHPTAGANYVFGVFGGGANFGFNVGSNRGIMNVPWGTNSGIPFSNTNTFGQVYSFDISKNGVYLDGILRIDTSQLLQEFKATKSFYVGWSNGTGTNQLVGNIYPMQMYENEILVRDLRPCVVAGEACLYDMVTGNLFYNQGTGTLGYMEK